MCFLVFPDDYESVINEVLDFVVGQDRVCHIIGITDNDICEINPNEIFFSNLELDSRGRRIDVHPEQAQVIIDDTNELECGEFYFCVQKYYVHWSLLCMYKSKLVPFWSQTE